MIDSKAATSPSQPLFGRKKRQSGYTLNYIVLIVLLIYALGPILVLGFNSLKDNGEIGRNPLGPPSALHFENFPNAWTQGQFGTTTYNSVKLVTGTVAAVLFLGGIAAYSLARLNPPGQSVFMLYILGASTIPGWIGLVPLFFMFQSLGLTDTHTGLILIYTAGNAPLSVFLLRSYMLQIPRDFEDAARVDGANDLQILQKVILPLSWPGFLTVGLVVALGVWGEFQTALIFLQDPEQYPVAMSYWRFTGRFSRDWSLTSAAAVMMIAPVIVFFLALQRRFIDGLTQGGVKA
ncbi:MAG: carbohydrate ABC transporter permease [Chloroflexota bacterium]